MRHEGMERYFTDILNVEPQGTLCHGVYSYARMLLTVATSTENYVELVKDARQSMMRSDVLPRALRGNMYDVYHFILLIIHDTMTEKE